MNLMYKSLLLKNQLVKKNVFQHNIMDNGDEFKRFVMLIFNLKRENIVKRIRIKNATNTR